MKPADALSELINRIAAVRGQSLLISTEELALWPAELLEALKSQELLSKATPAASAECPGCEQECVMPVHALPGTPHTAPPPFIVCDKLDNVNRVPVPLARLEQWRISGASIAGFVARALGLPRPPVSPASAAHWEIGLFAGARQSGRLALVADETLSLSLSRHSLALADVLTLDGGSLSIDDSALRRLLEGETEQPGAGVGSAEWRRKSARTAADARHNAPGGSRDKQRRMQEIWASGKYSTRDRCAEEECAALGMSFSTARRALRNTPDPERPT